MKKIIFRLVIFTVVLTGINFAFGFFLKGLYSDYQDKYRNPWGKFRWAEFYQAPGGSVKRVFLGNSAVMRGLNPAVFDSVLGPGSFNMASAAQGTLSSYYILQEVLNRQSPSAVVFNIWYMSTIEKNILNDYRLNIQHMKTDLVKSGYILNSLPDLEILGLFLPTYYYRRGLMYHFDNKDLSKLRPYVIPMKGFLPKFGFLGERDKNKNIKGSPFDLGLLEKKPFNFLEKAVKLCKQKGVRLIFITMPLAQQKIQRTQNYREVSQHFKNMASAHSVPYYDFNLPGSGIELSESLHFNDVGHLNITGANIFSHYLATVISKTDK